MPLMYCRYIDDCRIVTSTPSEMDECFNILNQQSQYIKLTQETPCESWLPYLNTQVKCRMTLLMLSCIEKGAIRIFFQMPNLHNV